MPEEMSTKAIIGGTLIDGTGSEPVGEATVLIKGSKIAAVGRGIQIPSGSERHRCNQQDGHARADRFPHA